MCKEFRRAATTLCMSPSEPGADVESNATERYQRVAAEYGAALERLAYAYEEDSDRRRDLLQDIHFQIWRSLEQFDSRCSLRTWVYRVAHNVATSHVVRQRRSRSRELVTLEEIEIKADQEDLERVGLAWLFEAATGNFWHNGATGGYSSYCFFNPKEDYAAVVLFNTTSGGSGSFADRMGTHVSERLSGKPAVSLSE